MLFASKTFLISSVHSRRMKQLVLNGDTPYLPEEIFIDILKRLPVKSLIRFQCVCKHWKNLFKTPSFIADHLHHSSNHNPSILFRRGGFGKPFHLCLLDCEMQVREVQKSPLIDNFPRAAIVCTSNGLVCVNLEKRGHGMSPPPLLLWNPATREIKQVPRNINESEGEFFIGFGFSPIVNDYKIVMLCFFRRAVYWVEVYSLTSDSWKEVECGNLVRIENLRHRTVAANGVMFWFGFGSNWQRAEDFIIVSFDIAMEEFRLIPMPVLGPTSYVTLTVHEDRLAVLSIPMSRKSESEFIDLWVMEEVIGSSNERWSWTKICTGSFSYSLTPVTIWGNEIFCKVVHELENEGSTIALFNLTTNEFKEDFVHTCDLSQGVFNYVESLIPAGGMKFAISM